MLIQGLVKDGYEIVLITKGLQKNEIAIEQHRFENLLYKCFFLPERIFSKQEIKQNVISSTWVAIQQIIEQEMPAIIHAHTYSTFFNIRHFEACKKYGYPIFFTAHIPGHFCAKGDLIKFNKKPCDGVINFDCSVCMFSKGLKTGLSNIIFQYPKKILQRLKILNKLGVGLICVSEWQKNQAIENGYNEANINVIRQALEVENYKPIQTKKSKQDFTIGYLGRLSSEKGSAFLLKIIAELILTTNLRFVLGIPLNNSNQKDISLLKILMETSGDRILIMDNINADNKEVFFAEIDCLLIPSFCIETGPIVLLEALVYNKYVVAPDVGGPLEFKNEFKDVITYQWNDLHSATQSLINTRKLEKGSGNHYAELLKKESLFIHQHQDLYLKSIH